jgi:hypothetical protein
MSDPSVWRQNFSQQSHFIEIITSTLQRVRFLALSLENVYLQLTREDGLGGRRKIYFMT